MDIVYELLQLQTAGWTVRVSADRRPLPVELLTRYPWLPDHLRSLLSHYDQIFRQDLKMWLLVSADYAGFTELAFRWNEWELQSLEGAGQDQAWRQEIIGFWDHHLPIALSVEGGYSYYALRSDGTVVAGREPEYEETMPAAKSYFEFLQRLKQGSLPQH